ncbi:acetyltransferase [Streptomyces chrestomyceticus JCM 4735]|uniref:Acetyltransferase n=1 Tax=Streptomyces chrestomyceticus JCM 4735 TaxID=1306181 RepID=A0A7U9KQC1_9ACTN|nr:maleylpyruvate isomerase N-terminal domain-containing protein [Streptomyces chrestomyceticus]GCD33356.1 acetyltransferase [Streptomyces chrestomyceticus JCM 4735]
MTTTATTAPSRTPVPPAAAWPGLLAAATDTCLDALLEGADQDWSRPADGLTWTCRETLDHLALGLTGYAGLLIARPTHRYITLFASLDPEAPVPACLEGLHIAARLLGATVRDTPADVRAWHPWGHADAVGFAAMGVTELLLHTYDITRALGVTWAPDGDLCTAVLSRLFPDAPAAPAVPPGFGPFDVLLQCTGRAALPGLPRRAEWQWDGSVH